MMDLCTGLVTFAIPLLALQLGASVVELGLIGTAGSVAYTISCAFTGKLADRFDRQRLMAIAALWAAVVFGILIYVEQVWMLFFITPLCWMTLALFWPALQATLAEGKNRVQLAKTLGTFNMVWTIGYMNGPIIGGLSYEVNSRFPFGLAMIGMLLLAVALFLLRIDRSVAASEPEDDVDTAPVEMGDTVRYRRVAWIAAFTGFFVMGILNNQFPKLAEELSISPAVLGYLLAVPRLIQFLIFTLARKSHFWQFRLYPLIVPQVATVIGMIITALASDPIYIGVGFATLGLLVGGSFTASQFYSFFQQERKGEGGALNEMIVGLGNVSGPLIGGVLAQMVGLRAPYVLCCVVLCAAIVIEYRLIRSK
ncbi:MAG: MFS transporter [Candidatus Latescibacteria bacterium]|nr:MFS transporter [Candidatus Latescibacterota bacterium]